MPVVTRSARETVMLEALERVRDRKVDKRGYCPTCMLHWDPGYPDHSRAFPCGIAARAIATVKAMDEAELRAGPVAT